MRPGTSWRKIARPVASAAEELQRFGVANAEPLEQGGDGVAAQHALLRDEAAPAARLRRRKLGKRDAALRPVSSRRSSTAVPGAMPKAVTMASAGSAQQQRAERKLPAAAGAGQERCARMSAF